MKPIEIIVLAIIVIVLVKMLVEERLSWRKTILTTGRILEIGDFILISGCDERFFNGIRMVTAINDSTTITIKRYWFKTLIFIIKLKLYKIFKEG